MLKREEREKKNMYRVFEWCEKWLSLWEIQDLENTFELSLLSSMLRNKISVVRNQPLFLKFY